MVPILSYQMSPGINATNVPINATIQLYFSALLDPTSIDPSYFILTDALGNIVPTKMNYSPSPSTGTSLLSLTPVSFLQSPPVYFNINTYYTVTLGTGIKSMGGGALSQLTSWTFYTNNSTDITPPTFAGAISAEGLDMGSIQLTWGPAVDNPGGTPSNKLVYSICYSISPTACQPSFLPIIVNPPARVDSNGNFNYVIKSLRPESVYYFMVRVSDLAGNQDANNIQVSASTKGGKIYVANFRDNNILGFDHPSKLLTNLPQVRSIKASQNGLSDPYGLFYDKLNDRLFVSTCVTNSNLDLIVSVVSTVCKPGTSTIVVFNNASNLTGLDQKPDWILVNGTTEVNALKGPVGIFLDNSPITTGGFNDTLYVANFEGRGVTIYDNITSSCQSFILAQTPCTATPRITNFSSTAFSVPFGITYDAQNKLLYVSNYVRSFQTTDTSGNVTPAVPGSTIAVFDVTTLTGVGGNGTSYNAKYVIGGQNALEFPAGLWLDPSSDTLYIANPGPILGPQSQTIYPGIVAICNVSLITNEPPSSPGFYGLPANTTCTSSSSATQYIAGSNTGLLWPVGVAVTTPLNSSTPSLYLSDYGNNKVSVLSPNPFFSSSGQSNTTFINNLPSEELFGLNSQIQKPSGITVSNTSGADNLFLLNLAWDQVLFFDNVTQNFSPSQCPGTPRQCAFSPDRAISPSILGPAGVFFNNSLDNLGNLRDRLYVTNFYNNTIVVFDGASTLSGNSYNAITKIVSSSALQNPFGIFVDTSQSREWAYVVNSRPDISGAYAGMYAVVIIDLSQCPANTGIYCNIDPPSNGVRVIHSYDFKSPSGIWVDEGLDLTNQPRDILYVSNRGNANFSSPGYLTQFSSSSTISGSISATKLVQGFQTSLFIPTGLFMDPFQDELYVANQGYNDILVFNQPENCSATQGTNICNTIPDRTLYNTTDLNNVLDGPSSLVIDFSSNQLYLSNLGIYGGNSSLMMFGNASLVSGQVSILESLTPSDVAANNYPLNFPESIVLDISR
ncbi:MAG: Ig-like domain-containing protein [Nitrospiria bacterium]